MPVPQHQHQRNKHNTWVRNAGVLDPLAAPNSAHHSWRRQVVSPEEPCSRAANAKSEWIRGRGEPVAQRPLPSQSTVNVNHLRKRAAPANSSADVAPGQLLNKRDDRPRSNSLRVRSDLILPPAAAPTFNRMSRSTISNERVPARAGYGCDDVHPRNKLQHHMSVDAAAISSGRPSRAYGAAAYVREAAAQQPSLSESAHRGSKTWVRTSTAQEAAVRAGGSPSIHCTATHGSHSGRPKVSQTLLVPAFDVSASQHCRSKVWLSEAAAAARPAKGSSCSYRPEKPSWVSPPSRRDQLWLQQLLWSRHRLSLLNSAGKTRPLAVSRQQAHVEAQQQLQDSVPRKRSMLSEVREGSALDRILRMPAVIGRSPGSAPASSRGRRSMGRGRTNRWFRGQGAEVTSPAAPRHISNLTHIFPRTASGNSRWQSAGNSRAEPRPARLERLGGHLYRVGGLGHGRSLQRQGSVAGSTSPGVSAPLPPAVASAPTAWTPRRRVRVAVRSPWKFSTPRTRSKASPYGSFALNSTRKRKSFRSVSRDSRSSSATKRLQTGCGKAKKAVRRQRLPPQIYCSDFCRTGSCPSRGNCRFVHDGTKVAVCPQWLQGSCPRDDAVCPLQHVRQPALMPLCAFFLQGMCGKVDCAYLHVNLGPDAAVCEAFLRGWCAAGAGCCERHLTVDMVRRHRKMRSHHTRIAAAVAPVAATTSIAFQGACTAVSRARNSSGRYFSPNSSHAMSAGVLTPASAWQQQQGLSWLNSPGQHEDESGESSSETTSSYSSTEIADGSSSASSNCTQSDWESDNNERS